MRMLGTSSFTISCPGITKKKHALIGLNKGIRDQHNALLEHTLSAAKHGCTKPKQVDDLESSRYLSGVGREVVLILTSTATVKMYKADLKGCFPGEVACIICMEWVCVVSWILQGSVLHCI